MVTVTPPTQDYRQVKHELGWADFRVRGGEAIQRHWVLVNLAFTFSWRPDIDKPGTPATIPGPAASDPPFDTCPRRLRRIRAWLVPFHELLRIIRSGALARVPREINRVTASPADGNGINLRSARVGHSADSRHFGGSASARARWIRTLAGRPRRHGKDQGQIVRWSGASAPHASCSRLR
ncbi:hypothetical protein AB0E10_15490 [Streptomyces sp. NPDC048045]|uniref:hypothetical protein n=1 Tax=Streptomyces sp. NPDC048045 TaxID=3154710 RepID=UPI0034189009